VLLLLLAQFLAFSPEPASERETATLYLCFARMHFVCCALELQMSLFATSHCTIHIQRHNFTSHPLKALKIDEISSDPAKRNDFMRFDSQN